jgi:hypothetical protein
MLDALTIVFMGISVCSVGLNIPLLKNYWSCHCMTDSNGNTSCSSDCRDVKIKPKITPKCNKKLKNVLKHYSNECESKEESKEESKYESKA